jgi:hypothetical protein
MPEPIVPTIDELGEQRFSFYPAILNVEHNEWVVRELKWSEILVGNCKSGDEVWVPRRYIGEVASTENPVVIVGLKKELEYKAGAIWPRERRVLKMPQIRAKNYPQDPDQQYESRPPSLWSRLAAGPEMKVGRLIGGVLAVGVALILVVLVFWLRPVKFQGIEQVALPLNANDDYPSVIRKLDAGAPSEDRWRSNTGEVQYRLLRFKDRPYALILMGADRTSARYIGAMNKDWKPVDSVEIPGGGDSLPLLRRLQKF